MSWCYIADASKMEQILSLVKLSSTGKGQKKTGLRKHLQYESDYQVQLRIHDYF